MPVWPASLPAPTLSSLVESPANNLIRSAMDKGPAKLRRRTTANVKPISFMLKLTAAQWDTLLEFYEVDTFSGAISFDFPHPRTEEPLSARFSGDPPQAAEQEGIVYIVNVSLEILP